MILILTNPNGDPHFLAVTRELERRAASYFVLDPAQLGHGSSLVVDQQRRRVRKDAETLDMGDVRSVWVRRPALYRASLGLLSPESDWVSREWDHATRGLWDLVDATWVSRPDAIREAGRKVRQLALAAELGLHVPQWMVTNEPDEARDFIRAQEGDVVVKALAQPTLLYSDRAVMLYTHRLRAEDLTHLDSVRWGPTFFQRFVPKQADVRVTVVGRRIFAAAIEPDDSEAARTDFRSVEAFDLCHRVMVLPRPVEAACLELVSRLGLRYGAIDLLLDRQGEFHFLEINPNGQWLWIEMMTKLPIAAAIADLLTQR